MMITVKRINFYDISSVLKIAKILNSCGRDMGIKYGLHHWDNPMIKTLVIVGVCLIKNTIYLVEDNGKEVATFQVKKKNDVLFFEKLAVMPSVGGKGYGSFCMKSIEKIAKESGLSKVQMEVYDKSQHAIDFYFHLGYKQVGKTETLKYTDVVMEKDI